jgi:hypothetical protein
MMKAMISLLALTIAGCGTTYKTVITRDSSLAGIDVGLTKDGNFWTVTAKNNTNRPTSLVWDESSYVSTTGQSSRLVRGQTRLIHSGQMQPPSPIPPGATITEYCIPEAQVQYAGSLYTPPLGNPENPARMYLVFDVNGQRQPWSATIRFVKPSAEKADP